MFRRSRQRRITQEIPAIAAQEILGLLTGKRLIHSGEAAACLRGIANNIMARSYALGVNEAGRPFADMLIEEAEAVQRPKLARSPRLLGRGP